MSAAWVAGSVRGRALARRALTGDVAQQVATRSSLREALRLLAGSTYGEHLKASMDLQSAQRAVAETALWHLRVLAGWLPPSGVHVVRTLAGWFEMADLQETAVALATSAPAATPFQLGALATLGARAGGAASLADLRRELAHSDWGDPRADALEDVLLGIHLGWARALRRAFPEHAEWGEAALALVAAKAVFLRDDAAPELDPGRAPELRSGWVGAGDIAAFLACVPPPARWALRDVAEARDLWKAERSWWLRLAADAATLLRDWRPGRAVVVGAAATLLADCWRTRAALARAARGGSAEPAEPAEPADATETARVAGARRDGGAHART